MRWLMIALLVASTATSASELCVVVEGAKIIAQDDENTYLGKVASSYDTDSIFNEYGTYGNEYNSESIWNEYSEFGNKFNSDSPFNEFSSNPPMLIKNGKVIGYLSANKAIDPSISPKLLKALCEDEF